MTPRSTSLNHPSGVQLRTPLLVPSFSSKGFLSNKKRQSEIGDIFRNTAEVITDTMLVSAFDIAHKHVPVANKFPCTPKLIFLDSGGYESGSDYDLSAGYRYSHCPCPWTIKRYKQVLDKWPSGIPAVFVNYDKASTGKSLGRQIQEASDLLSGYPSQLHCFLLKPIKGGRNQLESAIAGLPAHASKLSRFGVFGVAEKELGNGLWERMRNVFKIRKILDEAGVSIPIHVFGALDPLSSCLFFLSGAEIFDGLTWLRYAYQDGNCVYVHNFGAVTHGINQSDDFIKSSIFSRNYGELINLQLALRNYTVSKDINILSSKMKGNMEVIRQAIASLETLSKEGV